MADQGPTTRSPPASPTPSQRPQRLSCISKSRCAAAGACGDAGDRARCAGGRRARACRDLRRTAASRRHRQRRAGHRLAADHRRAHLRRHQHQRRSGPVTLRIDRRIIPEENGAEVEQAWSPSIEAAVPAGQGITVECRRIMLAEPLRPDRRGREAGRGFRPHAEESSGSGRANRASRSTPTPATIPPPESRRSSTAPGRARSSRPTPTAPTSTLSLPTCAPQPRSSP
jgi:hypothetical protein